MNIGVHQGINFTYLAVNLLLQIFLLGLNAMINHNPDRFYSIGLLLETVLVVDVEVLNLGFGILPISLNQLNEICSRALQQLVQPSLLLLKTVLDRTQILQLVIHDVYSFPDFLNLIKAFFMLLSYFLIKTVLLLSKLVDFVADVLCVFLVFLVQLLVLLLEFVDKLEELVNFAFGAVDTISHIRVSRYVVPQTVKLCESVTSCHILLFEIPCCLFLLFLILFFFHLL